MHVISYSTLRTFFEVHPDAEPSLQTWYDEAKRKTWTTPNEVRESFSSVSFVGKLAVFNIAGNKYRLVADIHYNRAKVFIDRIMTHDEYDRGLWKRG